MSKEIDSLVGLLKWPVAVVSLICLPGLALSLSAVVQAIYHSPRPCYPFVAAAFAYAVLWVVLLRRSSFVAFANVEHELTHDVPPLLADLHELSGELQRLGQGANTELDRLGRITGRVEEVADNTANILNALSGLTRAGQLVGLAAGVKTGVEVFLHRFRTQRGDGHGE